MASQTVVGVFGSIATAERAKSALLRAGVGEHVAMSRPLTEDGIAAEVPGQLYENQPGQPAEDSERARYTEKILTGACTLSAYARSLEDRLLIEELMRRNGARGMAAPPA
jgi:hypothetical protein